MSKKKAGKTERKSKAAVVGASIGATGQLLQRLGLGWVLDALTASAAAGIVAGQYGAGAAESQLRFYADAGRAIIAAERRITSSLAKGEMLALLQRLADAVSARIVAINSFLGIVTTADFDHIADRLADIDRRITSVERTRARKPRVATAAAAKSTAVSDSPDSAVVSERVATALEAALKRSPGNLSEQFPGKTSEKSRATSRANSAANAKAPAADADAEKVQPMSVSSVRVDRRPVIDSSTTMFIGSMPANAAIEPPPARASSVSSKPDAMSAFLARKPGGESDSHSRGRRRRTPLN